jgi:hypothetical protein
MESRLGKSVLYHMGLSENGSPTIDIKNEKKKDTPEDLPR